MGNKRVLTCWVGGCLVFLCLHVFTARSWVVGVGACFGLGIKMFYGEQTHCRVHVQHRVSVRRPLWWWLPAQPA